MEDPKVEEYAIKQRTVRSYPKGEEVFRGRPKKTYEIRETYQTNAGEFEIDEWRKEIREAIEKSGENELLERIKQHCRENCAWLHKEEDIEEYAMSCLASRAYRYWNDFDNQEEYIFFIG